MIADLDQWFPPAGPCSCCGFHDKRHRIWDAIMFREESNEDLGVEYDLPPEAIAAVRRIRPYMKEDMGEEEPV